MLKKKALRKIVITTFSVITVFIICIMPEKLSNNNYLNPKIDTIYVSNSTTEIYLLGSNDYLVKTNIILDSNKLEDKVKDIIEYLKISNKKIPNGLKGIIPDDTKLNSVSVESGTVTIDLSKEVLNVSLDKEEKLIESIVYSLINLDKIDGVIIKIDGNILKELPQSKKELPLLLNRTYGINKVIDIDNIDNVKKVVIYYKDIISNTSYDVPVTKYLNDEREKIDIIIDNLSSNYIYESNLISLLNSNTKLLNYEIVDKSMTLNFNQGIFTNNKLLVEVTYQVVSSVFENYDINKIIFEVDGKNIFEYEK